MIQVPDDNELILVDPSRFRVYPVNKKCELRAFVDSYPDQLGYDEPRSYFFEFTNRIENISDEKEVILMEKQVMLSFIVIRKP